MLTRRTPIKRTTRLARSPMPPRSAPMRRQSKRTRAAAPARRDCVDIVHKRSGHRCEVRINGRRCARPADHVHEKLSRARGGSIIDPENCLDVCFAHHRRIHDFPAWAESVGLLLPTPERTATK